MKVIFLDIDGVLNSDRSIFALPMREIFPGEYRLNYLLSKADPVAIAILNKIIKETGAKIVVSSANRKVLGFDGVKQALLLMGVEGEVIGVTGTTGGNRGTEIQEWLDNNEVEAYVIIDDSSDMLEEQMQNFVRVDPSCGLAFPDMRKAIHILTGTPPTSFIIL